MSILGTAVYSILDELYRWKLDSIEKKIEKTEIDEEDYAKLKERYLSVLSEQEQIRRAEEKERNYLEASWS